MLKSIFNLFSSKKEDSFIETDFTSIGADMHSHLIPGIDDGAQTLEESIELIKGLKALGFTTLITTPHIMSDFYRNKPETILPGLDLVREEIAKQGLGVTIYAAAEYYLDGGFEKKIKEEKLLSFGKENYLLFELSYLNRPDSMSRVIFDLISAGYKPILAHPERYPYFYDKFEVYKEIVDRGALLQLNTNSLTGYYSPGAKAIAERLIDEGLVSFIGTDTHKTGHVKALGMARQSPHLYRLIESGKLKNITLA
jgi:tyrosine-protein phosphatase YwqE